MSTLIPNTGPKCHYCGSTETETRAPRVQKCTPSVTMKPEYALVTLADCWNCAESFPVGSAVACNASGAEL